MGRNGRWHGTKTMINGIGPSTTGRIDTARSGAAQRTAAPAKVDNAPKASAAAPSLAADLVSAMGPPLDMKKIEAIRAAISEGRYAIDPQAIADKMVDTDLPAKS